MTSYLIRPDTVTDKGGKNPKHAVVKQHKLSLCNRCNHAVSNKKASTDTYILPETLR